MSAKKLRIEIEGDFVTFTVLDTTACERTFYASCFRNLRRDEIDFRGDVSSLKNYVFTPVSAQITKEHIWFLGVTDRESTLSCFVSCDDSAKNWLLG